MKECSVAMAATGSKRFFSGQLANQCRSIRKPRTQHQQNKEEQMDDVLETINIAIPEEISLIRNITTGNTHLVPAFNKIMEAAMDFINTLI